MAKAQRHAPLLVPSLEVDSAATTPPSTSGLTAGFRSPGLKYRPPIVPGWDAALAGSVQAAANYHAAFDVLPFDYQTEDNYFFPLRRWGKRGSLLRRPRLCLITPVGNLGDVLRTRFQTEYPGELATKNVTSVIDLRLGGLVSSFLSPFLPETVTETPVEDDFPNVRFDFTGSSASAYGGQVLSIYVAAQSHAIANYVVRVSAADDDPPPEVSGATVMQLMPEEDDEIEYVAVFGEKAVRHRILHEESAAKLDKTKTLFFFPADDDGAMVTTDALFAIVAGGSAFHEMRRYSDDADLAEKVVTAARDFFS